MSKYSADQNILNGLIKQYGVAHVLDGVSTSIKDGEKAIRDNHDANLGNAFDFLVSALTDMYPNLKKMEQSLARMVLLSNPTIKSMKIRKSNSPMQSESMHAAHKLIKQLGGDLD